MSNVDVEYDDLPSERYIFLFIVVGSFAVLFNLVEIIFLHKTMKKKLHKSHIYLLNLAISDLLVGIIVMIISGIGIQRRVEKRLPRTLMFLQNFAYILGLRITLLMSIFSLLALTIDRLVAVVSPFKNRNMKKKSAVLACVIMWVVSILLCSMHAFLLRETQPYYVKRNFLKIDLKKVNGTDHEHTVTFKYEEISYFPDRREHRFKKMELLLNLTQFVEKNPKKMLEQINRFPIFDRIYEIEQDSFNLSMKQRNLEYIIIPVLVYLTIVFLLVAYLRIWKEMRKSKSKVKLKVSKGCYTAMEKTRNRKEKKFKILAVSMVLAFAFCWLPFSLNASYIMASDDRNGFLQETYLLVLIYLNSLINPFLYFKLMTKMKTCKKRRITDLRLTRL